MLNPAEVSLAVRDPALPGLRLLLDNERLGEWLSDLLGREVVIRRRHLRYKPGTSCVLHAEGAGQPLLVSAYRPADSAKLGKTCKQAPAGTVVGVDVPLGVLVSTLAADRDLVALAVLPDESRRQLLLDRMLGEGAVLPGAEPEMLRYKPHRRWVGLLPTTSGPVLLRAYRRTAITSAAQAVSRLQDGAPRTPRLLGWDRRLGLAAVEFLAGRPAHDPTVADTT
ncbi:MAG: hypothetical protein L0H41_13765, partial [Microlunatus sp.]|nr:hypothetical protein [Microlunatus sp.]